MSRVKLALNPYEPNYKSVDGLTLMVHAPFNRVSLTTEQSEPHLEDMVAGMDHKKTRTVNLSFCDPATHELEFNIDGISTHAVHAKGRDYIISLDEIGEEEVPQEPGRKYLYFIFNLEVV